MENGDKNQGSHGKGRKKRKILQQGNPYTLGEGNLVTFRLPPNKENLKTFKLRVDQQKKLQQVMLEKRISKRDALDLIFNLGFASYKHYKRLKLASVWQFERLLDEYLPQKYDVIKEITNEFLKKLAEVGVDEKIRAYLELTIDAVFEDQDIDWLMDAVKLLYLQECEH